MKSNQSKSLGNIFTSLHHLSTQTLERETPLWLILRVKRLKNCKLCVSLWVLEQIMKIVRKLINEYTISCHLYRLQNSVEYIFFMFSFVTQEMLSFLRPCDLFEQLHLSEEPLEVSIVATEPHLGMYIILMFQV